MNNVLQSLIPTHQNRTHVQEHRALVSKAVGIFFPKNHAEEVAVLVFSMANSFNQFGSLGILETCYLTRPENRSVLAVPKALKGEAKACGH